MKKMLGLGLWLGCLLVAPLADAQDVILFNAPFPQVTGGGSLSPVLYLSGDSLAIDGLNTANLWLVSVHFPTAAPDPAVDLYIGAPIISVYAPIDGIGGGESFRYEDVLLNESQRQLLLAGQAQLVLTQNIISIDPAFRPDVFQANIVPVPEPSAFALLIGGGLCLWWFKGRR